MTEPHCMAECWHCEACGDLFLPFGPQPKGRTLCYTCLEPDDCDNEEDDDSGDGEARGIDLELYEEWDRPAEEEHTHLPAEVYDNSSLAGEACAHIENELVEVWGVGNWAF